MFGSTQPETNSLLPSLSHKLKRCDDIYIHVNHIFKKDLDRKLSFSRYKKGKKITMNKEENAGSSTSHFKEGSVVNNVLSNLYHPTL